MTELAFFESFVSDHKIALIDAALEERTDYLTVVLDDVYQARNISAVVRSCDCFGVQNVHVLEGRNKFELRDEVTRGAGKWMTVHRHDKSNGSSECIDELKDSGYKVYATVPTLDAVSIDDLPVDQKIALVFGNEKDGVSEEVLNQCDGSVTIPMYGFTESFNISVSASVFMHHLTHKFRSSRVPFRLTEDEKTDLRLVWYKATTKDAKALENRYKSEYGM